MWNTAEIADQCAAALAKADAEGRAEDAVRGIDALAEVDLHPILARGLALVGGGGARTVLREVMYPRAAAVSRGARPARRDRERCDLVILPEGAIRLRDAVDEARRLDSAASTLFADEVARDIARDDASIPSDAMWLEVKVVGQFVVIDGAARANRAWGSELTRAVTTDAGKLAAADEVHSAGLLLVVFAASAEVARHDVGVALDRCPHKDRFGWVRSREVPVCDRIGNTIALVTLVPIEPAA